MRRSVVTLGACLLTMTAIGGVSQKSVGALELPAPVRPLTAAQFAGIGIAAGAEPLSPDPSVAEVADALAVDQSAVTGYIEALCNGTFVPLGSPQLFPYPSDVFAYAAIFDAVDTQCLTSDRALALERGRVAGSMARNQLALDNLLHPKSSKVDKLCRTFQDSEKLTAPAIALLAAKLFKLGESGQKAAEIGVSLLIGNCQSVFG